MKLGHPEAKTNLFFVLHKEEEVVCEEGGGERGKGREREGEREGRRGGREEGRIFFLFFIKKRKWFVKRGEGRERDKEEEGGGREREGEREGRRGGREGKGGSFFCSS